MKRANSRSRGVPPVAVDAQGLHVDALLVHRPKPLRPQSAVASSAHALNSSSLDDVGRRDGAMTVAVYHANALATNRHLTPIPALALEAGRERARSRRRKRPPRLHSRVDEVSSSPHQASNRRWAAREQPYGSVQLTACTSMKNIVEAPARRISPGQFGLGRLQRSDQDCTAGFVAAPACTLV